MKTTVKEYKTKSELLRLLNGWAEDAKFEKNWSVKAELDKQYFQLEDTYFHKLPTVNVSYTIGGRSYYEAAVKIGSKHFQNGRALTKSRGFYNLTEIPEITSEMHNDMISDLYYY